MLTLSNVKDQIKSLSESENYFLLSELEPKHQNNFMEVSFKANEDNFEILDLAESINDDKVYRTIKYEDVKVLDIDNILVGLELKNGTVYFLKQQRNNLVEILEDMKKCGKDIIIDDGSERLIGINDFNVTEQENEIVIAGKEFDIHCEIETGGRNSFKIDKNAITGIDESYLGADEDRNVRIGMKNGDSIMIM